MSHLSAERLAALIDEPPTTVELSHLAACAGCARERVVHQTLGELAANESTRLGAPLTNWDSLRRSLVADGLIGDTLADRGFPVGGRAVRVAPRGTRGWGLQAAAAMLLVAGGLAAGRYTAGYEMLPANGAQQAVTGAALVADSLPHFASIEDARAEQSRAQAAYQSATAYLAQRDTTNRAPESPGAMRTRLAALDQAYRVMGRALDEAPYDPVINGYYLTTLGQREATIRQINTAMPASMRIMSY